MTRQRDAPRRAGNPLATEILRALVTAGDVGVRFGYVRRHMTTLKKPVMSSGEGGALNGSCDPFGSDPAESAAAAGAELVPVAVQDAEEETPTSAAMLYIVSLPYSWRESAPPRRRIKYRFGRRRALDKNGR